MVGIAEIRAVFQNTVIFGGCGPNLRSPATAVESAALGLIPDVAAVAEGNAVGGVAAVAVVAADDVRGQVVLLAIRGIVEVALGHIFAVGHIPAALVDFDESRFLCDVGITIDFGGGVEMVFEGYAVHVIVGSGDTGGKGAEDKRGSKGQNDNILFHSSLLKIKMGLVIYSKATKP